MHGMMSYDPAYNPRKRQAPTLRPDYVVRRQANVVAILDAKYRDLWENKLPEHMLYQLAMYALSQPGGIDAAILYPTLRSDAQEVRIIIRDPVYNAGTAHVILRPVNLLRLDELLAGPKTAQSERDKARFAVEMVFGTGSR